MEPDSGLDVVVDDLPGIGRSHQMTGINGGRITVVVHHSGRRVVYGLNAGADQASAVELSDQQARKLGAVLGGAFSSRRWWRRSRRNSTTCSSTGWPSSPTRLALTSPSPSWRYVYNRGDHHCDHPRRQAITAPEPSEIPRAGDRLVFVSRRQDMGPFRDLVVGCASCHGVHYRIQEANGVF
jgi:K+/H+ antiporter YhaU regulatory subunit KhtT